MSGGGGYMSWGVYVQGVSVQGLVSFFGLL